MVSQEFTQIEGLDYHETYALVARIEGICILLAYFNHRDFKLYQMGLKNVWKFISLVASVVGLLKVHL